MTTIDKQKVDNKDNTKDIDKFKPYFWKKLDKISISEAKE